MFVRPTGRFSPAHLLMFGVLFLCLWAFTCTTVRGCDADKQRAMVDCVSAGGEPASCAMSIDDINGRD